MSERQAGLAASHPEASARDLVSRALDLMPGAGAAVVDGDLRIVDAFGEVFGAIGPDSASPAGRRLREVFPGEQVKLLESALESTFEGIATTLEVPGLDGPTRYRIETRPVSQDDEVVAALLFATDTTGSGRPQDRGSSGRGLSAEPGGNTGRAPETPERLTAERELAEARRLFETAFINAPNGMALVGLDGSFLRVNPAMSELTGYTEEELSGLKVADIAHPDDMQEQVELIRRALRNEFDSYDLEKRFTRKSGEVVWLVLAVSLVRGESGTPLYVVAQTTNISQHKQVEVDLRTEIGRDALTGLANRRQIEGDLEDLLGDCRRNGSVASLIVLDLDGLKTVNDLHGHDAGDNVIRFVAEGLRGRIRSSDIAARLGGDEFVVLLPGVGPEEAKAKAVELMDHFDRLTYDPDGLALGCGVSAGSATMDSGTECPEVVFREADLDMYETKRRRSA